MFKPLRDKILELAITGKLVPQLDNEPAVEQIGPAPAKEEEPFALPEKWKWVQLENLCLYLQRGKSPKYSEIKKYPVVAQKCNQWDGLHLELALFFDPNTLASYKAERFLQQDDVLLNSTGTGTLGRVGSYDVAVNPYELAVADGHVTVIRANSSCLMPTYVKFVLSSAVFQMIITEAGTGTTKQQELALSKVKQLWIPLPPIEEQRRIVAKLDDIMGNLERMDQAYTELSGPMVKHFKNLVLQQAISGQLVPQLDSEPAVEQIGLAPAKEDEPFALPKKWKWVRLGLLGSWKSGQTPKRTEQSYWVRGSINWLKTGELNDGVITFSEEKISQKAVEDLNIRVNPVDSVLIAMYGATAGKLGILSKPCATNQACCACIVDTKLLANWFLFYVLLAFRAELIGMAAGSAQSNLSKEKIESFWFPLPPIEEQRRIVARIEELFGDVDKLLEWQQFA